MNCSKQRDSSCVSRKTFKTLDLNGIKRFKTDGNNLSCRYVFDQYLEYPGIRAAKEKNDREFLDGISPIAKK